MSQKKSSNSANRESEGKPIAMFDILILPRIYSIQLTKNILFEELLKLNPKILIVSKEQNLPENAFRPSKYRALFKFKIFLSLGIDSPKKSREQLYKILHQILRDHLGPEQILDHSDKNISDLDKLSELTIDPVKSSKTVIRSLTELDFDPRFGGPECRTEAFSFNWHREQWARQNVNTPFSKEMDFVKKHRNYDSLNEYLAEHQKM